MQLTANGWQDDAGNILPSVSPDPNITISFHHAPGERAKPLVWTEDAIKRFFSGDRERSVFS